MIEMRLVIVSECQVGCQILKGQIRDFRERVGVGVGGQVTVAKMRVICSHTRNIFPRYEA